MRENRPNSRLSLEAIRELKEIVHEEFGSSMPDQEIEEVGTNLLRLFRILQTSGEPPKPAATEVTEQEFKVLKFLHNEIYHNKKSPSVRDVARALGFRSSRTGFRILAKLIKRGLVYRDNRGDILLSERIKECRVDLQIK